MKDSNRAVVVTKLRLPTVGSDNLLHQMQSQNVGRIGIGAGVGEVSQHRFRVACAVVPDFQHKLSVYNFCRYPNITAGGIVPDTVVQEVIYGPCQKFPIGFQHRLSCRFPDQQVNAVGFFQ